MADDADVNSILEKPSLRESWMKTGSLALTGSYQELCYQVRPCDPRIPGQGCDHSEIAQHQLIMTAARLLTNFRKIMHESYLHRGQGNTSLGL